MEACAYLLHKATVSWRDYKAVRLHEQGIEAFFQDNPYLLIRLGGMSNSKPLIIPTHSSVEWSIQGILAPSDKAAGLGGSGGGGSPVTMPWLGWAWRSPRTFQIGLPSDCLLASLPDQFGRRLPGQPTPQ